MEIVKDKINAQMFEKRKGDLNMNVVAFVAVFVAVFIPLRRAVRHLFGIEEDEV